MMGGMVGMGTGAGGDEGIKISFFFLLIDMSYDWRVIPLFTDFQLFFCLFVFWFHDGYNEGDDDE